MDELAKQFADLARQYGPSVADAAKHAVQIEAYSCLAGSIGWFMAAAFFVWCGRFLWRKATATADGEVAYVFGAIAFVLGALLVFPGVWAWIDPWTWTAIAHPELWIAKKAFHI